MLRFLFSDPILRRRVRAWISGDLISMGLTDSVSERWTPIQRPPVDSNTKASGATILPKTIKTFVVRK